MPKQLHVNLFEMNCVSHIMHGLWVHEDNNRHRFNEIGFWIELAQLLEHGKFDTVFLADILGVYDEFRNGPETAIREGLQIPNNDPLLLIPAMAQATRHLGFGTTCSTSYEPPFAFARRMSTLDHLTRGRVAWNIVTSYLPSIARNFGQDQEVPHDRRYEIADEYLDVLYKLWEGSWDDDAVIRDRENRVYTDPSKVRAINHHGEHFKVAGPHLSQPSPQRTPLLIQATASPAGIAFAGRHAELLFTAGLSRVSVRKNIASVRAALAANGRQPGDIKFIALADIIVAKTDAEVSKKVESYQRLRSFEAPLAHMGVGLDLTKYAPSELMRNIIARKDPGWDKISPLFYKPEQTVGEVIYNFGTSLFTAYTVAGTPDVVADEIQRWMDDDGIDGINLLQWVSFETARDFIELVVPELQRRGRYREAYNEGETLRERLFGAGRARLPASHFGARYRDPAQLQIPAERLKLSGFDNTSIFDQKAG